jgi:hypothetical protein
VGRMLTVDPERRATIPQIRKHAWLRTCAAAAAAADSERVAACLVAATASAQATDSLLAGMTHLGLAQPPGATSPSC